ncbi:MAG: hypothetical protein WBO58_18690 [Gammaproteobacteria bacterium]
MKFYLKICALFIFMAAPLQAAQDAIVVREALVYSATNSTSQPVGKIAAGTRVSVFERKGGWKEVYYEKESIVGWVRSYQIREGSFAPAAEVETESDSRGFLAGLAAFSRKASGFFRPGNATTSSGTATIGVRGLSEVEINAARPDYDEFKKMQQYASNNVRLVEFGQSGQLSVNNVKHLAANKKQGKRIGANRVNEK